MKYKLSDTDKIEVEAGDLRDLVDSMKYLSWGIKVMSMQKKYPSAFMEEEVSPDITMCSSLECPRRGKCYRFMAIPSMYQSYMDPFVDGEKCGFFLSWPRTTKKKRPTAIDVEEKP